MKKNSWSIQILVVSLWSNKKTMDLILTSSSTSIEQKLMNIYCDKKQSYKKQQVEYILRNRYGMPYYRVMNWADEWGDPAIAYEGIVLTEAEYHMNNSGRVREFETQEQTWSIYSYDKNNEEIECVESVELLGINDITNDILSDVQAHFGGKYTSFDVDGESDLLKLRIADHSGKHANNNGSKCLSIVIAEKNPTLEFRTNGPEGISNEHYFDSSYTAKEIIEQIYELLEYEDCIFSKSDVI